MRWIDCPRLRVCGLRAAHDGFDRASQCPVKEVRSGPDRLLRPPSRKTSKPGAGLSRAFRAQAPGLPRGGRFGQAGRGETLGRREPANN